LSPPGRRAARAERADTVVPVDSSPLVRAVFAVLVLATTAAFFLAQALKQEEPVVLRFAVDRKAISPDRDGVGDVVRAGFDLSERAEVSFAIIDGEGTEVRQLVDDRELEGDRSYRFAWNGRDDSGRKVPDGRYRMRVVRRREGRVLDSLTQISVDSVPPRVRLLAAEPGVIAPGRPGAQGSVRVSYRGPRNASPIFTVYRTDGDLRVVRRFRGDGSRSGVWDGSTRTEVNAPPGSYAFAVDVRDRAGNLTRAPKPAAPTDEVAGAGTGVAVRQLTLGGPLGALTPGEVAELEIAPEQRVRYSLTRLGDPTPLRTGSRRGGRLRVRIPASARTGVYVVRVSARGRVARRPLAVAGLPTPRSASARPRPLVVLPTVTWQGRNPFDSDLDGFPDTLDGAAPLPVQRPFEGGRLPPGLTREAAPLLRFLDRERIAYDLTTDVALTRGEGPSIANAPGIAIAGTATWLPREVRDPLLAEVEESGLPVASFGAQSLRRTVALTEGSLRDPSPDRPDDLFGERTEPFASSAPAPLRVQRDELGLFGGIDEVFGEFSRFERSEALPNGAQLLAGAGREAGEPAFVGYRLGEGTVVRVGTPEWVQGLEEGRLGLEVPRVTRALWRLLGRER
jgi:flagellar hook assembly protein FlgD